MQLSLASIVLACSGNQRHEDRNAKSSFNVSHFDSLLSYKKTALDTVCKGWNLTDTDVLKFIIQFDTISNYDWHHCYGSFDCQIEGKVLLKGKSYSYSLNAGGWIRLSHERQEVFLGSTSLSDSVYFVSVNFCDENWD